MSNTQQPEALNLEEFRAKVTRAAREPLLARIAELEEQLSAIGAGGVEPLRKARAASAETKISALMSKISTLVDKRLSCEPCAEAEEDLLQFLRTRYAAPAHPAEGVPAQAGPVGYVTLAALTSRTHADDYAKCFATEAALLENYPAAKAIAVFDHAATNPTKQGLDAAEWEEIHTLPTCDDLIWLYCQDTNTVDGPIAPEPNLEEYGWSHWAYANAPSTVWIDAAQAKQEVCDARMAEMACCTQRNGRTFAMERAMERASPLACRVSRCCHCT